MTCAAFLIKRWIHSTAWDGILGTRTTRIILSNGEVFSDENVSVDIQKITPIQRIAGSQYTTNRRRLEPERSGCMDLKRLMVEGYS